MKLFRIFWQFKSFASASGTQVDAAEQQRQFAVRDFDSSCQFFFGFPVGWELEGALLQTFVPDRQSVLIPVKNLELVSIAIAKHEQMPRQWILLHQRLGHSAETIEASPHIRRLGAQINFHAKRQTDHHLAPSSSCNATSGRSDCRSLQTRATAPPGISISIWLDGSAIETNSAAADSQANASRCKC